MQLLLGLLLTAGFPFPNFISTSIAAEVTITWNANTESDLDGYSVYRNKGSSRLPYELIADLSLDDLSDPDSPEVTLTSLMEFWKYYFIVTAYDTSGNESGFSNELCIEVSAGSILDCSSVSIAAEVTITWNANAESDLDGYLVYRNTGSPRLPYELIADLSLDDLSDPYNPEVTLTSLMEFWKYYFIVTAYDTSGNESGFSNELCVEVSAGSILDCSLVSSPDDGGGNRGE